MIHTDELHGWIQPCVESFDVNECRRELESLGVNVGPWDLFNQEFEDCILTVEALKKLDPLWGCYIWGLTP
jgi:hypothetical protein